MPSDRPSVNPAFTPTQKLLFGGTIIFILLNIIVISYYYPSLPDKIPSHFGISGKPDKWSGKGSIFALLIPTSIVCISLLFISFFPRIYNYLVEITPANAERQYSMSRTLILVLAFEISFFSLYGLWKSIQVAFGQAFGLGIWALPIFLILIFSPLIFYIRASLKAR